MRSARLPRALVVLGTLFVAACGSPAGAQEPPPSAPPGGVAIVASGMAFDRAELLVQADQAFALLFENRESAPHNIAILDPGSGQSIYAGEVFGGQDSRTYAVPAIRPGTYQFRCDVHPDMAGTLVAVAPTPAPAPG